jgi:hypothetical protein
LTNFSNGKQTQESLESGFRETTFRETNMVLGFFNSFEVNFKGSLLNICNCVNVI